MSEDEQKDQKDETTTDTAKVEVANAEQKPTEKAPEKKDTTTKTTPAKFKKLVEEIETMSVLELSELVKLLEDRFGVSAAAPVAVAAPASGSADNAAAAEEKS